MSENLNSSELAVEESASAPPPDTAQPEPVSAPKKGEKKKMWVVVVAVIVVAALIGSAAYMWVFAGKELGVTMTPDDDPLVVPAGSSVDVSVNVTYGNDPVTADDDVVYLWSVDPYTSGDFDRFAKAAVEFTAGTETGECTISCKVTFDGKSKVVERDVTIDPPFLETVDVLPSYKEVALDAEWEFNATAYDSVGAEVTGATFSWTVSGVTVGDYTLSATTGSTVTFSASVETVVTLTATATDGDETASGSATVNVTADIAVRSIDYYWDDFFNHPLGQWYDDRLFNYGDEYAITDAYPWLYIWEGSPPGNIWIYTMARLNMDGKNMSELNMNENPEFLPYFGTTRGGTATLDWYMDYITEDEAYEKLGPGAIAWHDGWLIEWEGDTTLDRQAAKAVLGITDAGFDDFDTWWASNGADIKGDWESWLNNEAGNDRLAIYACYEYDLTFVNFDMDAQKVGDNVVITFDTISWGMEALMLRWMYEAWMPTEWYMEDMNFDAVIGPERADVTLDTAVAYSMYCYETTDEADPCWAWEALKQDYVESSPEYPISDFDVYKDFTYLNYAPGSDWYEQQMAWDYTPGTWDLLEGETLTFEWPEGDVMYFVHSPGSDGEIADIGVLPVPDTTNFMDTMTCVYAEPMESDTPDIVEVDLDSRTISYTGPFDMLEWSETQTAHEWLVDEWDRLGVLPYGAPYIEFRPGSTISLDLRVEDVRSPLEIGEASSFNVTIVNEMTGDPHVSYTGTVTFESNGPAAVLPDDYTFVPADMGTHEFTVVFNTVDPVTHSASYYLTVSDVDDDTLVGTQSGILVKESPRIESFDVALSGADVIATEPESITVTAYNQWDEVFTEYDGTVNFTSDDVGADLPVDTAFTPAMEGVQVFSVTFSTPGLHVVNVSDVDVPEAYGEASVTVLDAPVADHFLLTGVNDPSSTLEQPETMVITVYDQYDRAFMAYDGTVSIECNESVGVTLPGEQTFVIGDPDISVELTFTVEGTYEIYVNDTSAPTVKGTLSVWVVGLVVADHFEVTGIEDMWENNYSGVTVTCIDNLGTIYENYVGEVTFSSNASGVYELPADYTFVAGDNGVRDFPASVMFDEPDTVNVTVEDKSDSTLNGSQEDIVIEDLVACSMEIVGPDTAMENATFSVTVTVYHQYGEPFAEYIETVGFSTSDTSGYAEMPLDYEFLLTDAGTRAFDDLKLAEVGSQTITVTDTVLSDVLDVEVTEYVASSITYKIYDMFEEVWHPFWDYRITEPTTWDTERILTEDAGDVTYLYSTDQNPKGNSDQGLIYAPYRWNIDATSIPNMDVHEPMLMPVLGSAGEVPGAEATVDAYAQYLYTGTGTWWQDYWIATWGGELDWVGDDYAADDINDGYFTGTVYTVTMNRPAAEEWLGMPQDDIAATWWTDNGEAYRSDWKVWIDDQGNDVFDIFCGYEWPYYDLGTYMSLTDGGTEVTLEIAHISWGWEALLTRWLNHTQVSVHQPYFEDITVQIDYKDSMCDFYMDAVAQWSLHAVKQNASAEGDNAPGAWVWEPLGLDYIPATGTKTSTFDPYYVRTYESWNCGDPQYSEEVTYEGTPWAFSLPDYGTLVIELPTGDTLPGYYGEPVGDSAIKDVWGGDTSIYDDIRYRGSMEPGFNITNGCPGITYVGNVMTIPGPFDFDNPRGDGTLYHGAPWLEFNVVEAPPKAASSAVSPVECAPSLGVVAEEPVAAAAVSTAGEIVSLVGVMCAVLLAIAALAVGGVRRQDLY